jgi:hypothetical protein
MGRGVVLMTWDGRVALLLGLVLGTQVPRISNSKFRAMLGRKGGVCVSTPKFHGNAMK